MTSQPSVATAAKRNIETIAQLEEQLLAKQSFAERLGSGIAGFFGSFRFIIVQLLFIFTWIILNLNWDTRYLPFDHYPFELLSLIVGIEFIFLTTFVLINQKRQIRRTEQWAHLNLQLSMLTEHEVTQNLAMINTVCKKFNIETSTSDQEVNELTKTTEITALVNEIKKTRNID